MVLFRSLKLNRCDWYILFWVIYYLQGILYSEGGSISLALLALLLAISMKYAMKVMACRSNPVYFKGLNLLIVMFTFYGFFYILVNPSTVRYSISGISLPSYNYIKGIYLSLLPIYPFYYYSKKGYLTEYRLQKWGLVFLISVLLSYFNIQQEALQKLLEKGSSKEEITNNAGYLFLSCIPLLVVYRSKPILQFFGLAFVLMFIVLGMKRGAIAIGTLLSLYFIFQAVKNSTGKSRFIIISLSIAICFVAIWFFLYQMDHSDYMMKRIQDTMEGNSSSRDTIYSFFWTYFIENASVIHYLIGCGANGTLEMYGVFAHNDWLEIAVNQGMLGVIIYAIYWFCFYRTWTRASNVEARTIIALSLIIYFAKTLFSMSYNDMSYVATCTLGFALATMKNPNKSN